MTLLVICGVSKSYGRTVALEGVDLEIPAKGRTAIVGPSGSGKTTLLRLIAGFERPDAGSIVMAGDVLSDDTSHIPAHRRGIGYVSQDGALFPHLSVAENVGFAIPRRDRRRHARIAQLLDLVQLDPTLSTRRPHELSGGQQQRVALARALALHPRLIVFDEPFSALDTGLRDSLRKAVGDVLAAAGVSTVLVTHDQAEALSFATHLAVLREGRLVQSGPPEDLYRRPRDPSTAAFLGEALILPARLEDGWADCILGRVETGAGDRRGSATILVRPEQLELEPASVSEPGGTRVVVTEVAFGGATTAVRLCWIERAGACCPAAFTCRIPGPPPRVGDKFSVRMLGSAHVFE